MDQRQELTTTQEFHQLKVQVGDIDDKVDRVLNVLTGNVLDKNDLGMIGRMKDLTERVAKMERKVDRFVIILCTASAFGGYGIIEFLIKIFSKTV